MDAQGRHIELLNSFYTAFQQKDWAAMGTLYHDEAIFYDPVFLDLNAAGVRAMWKMLCERARDLHITFSCVANDEEYASCTWTATYLFSATGRKVINNVHSYFRFYDDLIIEQTDEFNFHKWSRQALGATGLLLGWTPLLRNSVSAKARKNLKSFMEKSTENLSRS